MSTKECVLGCVPSSTYLIKPFFSPLRMSRIRSTMNQISSLASKQPKLLRLLNLHAPSKGFSLLRRLCVQIDRPETPTTPETGSKTADEEAVVTQVVDFLRSTDSGWDSGELGRLLFSNPPSSPLRLLRVTLCLRSTSKALHFFEWVQSDSQFSSDPSFLSSAFQGVIELASREPDSQKRFLKLLAMAKERNIPLSVKSACLVIRSFRRAGMVEELLNVYNELNPSLKETHVRNMLIEALVGSGRFKDARVVLDGMFEPDSKFPPSKRTGFIVFSALLKLVRLGRVVSEGEFVEFVSKFGEKGVFPGSKQLIGLINGLCKSRKTDSAWDVLHAVMKSGGPVETPCCNALLTGLRNDRNYDKMNYLLAEMKEMKIQPNIVTFGIVIDHLCKHRRVDEALELFEKMSGGEGSFGVPAEPDVITYNTLIDGLCKVGRQEEGLSLMQRMTNHGLSPNTVTYNCLIDGFCKSGEMDRSQELFDKMNKEGISPNVVTVNALVDGMCRHGRISSAIEFFREMQKKGLKGNSVTYTFLIRAFCNTNNISKAKELFDEMLKVRCNADAFVYYTMISGLAQAGQLDDASFVALKMKKAGFSMDTVSYNILISGFCKKNKLDKAHQLLKEMEEFQVKPDSVTYNTLISHFSKNGDFGSAHKVMRKMIEDRLMPTVVTYGALIHAYCLNGNLEEAMKIFREMSTTSRVPPNTVIYNVLINSLCKSNDVEAAASLFDDMKKKGARPTVTTYNAMFKGLQEKNWLKKAFELMDRMNEEACNPDYITMEILTEWLSAVGETEKLKSFVRGSEAMASSTA